MSKNIKCVAVGDGAVGKTCLLISYKNNEFPSEYVPTVFDNYVVEKEFLIDGQKETIQLDLWDTAGQEQFDKLRVLSYRNVSVFLYCFDCTDEDSFTNLNDKWHYEITHHTKNPKILLCGLKCDLKDDTKYLTSKSKKPIDITRINEYVKQFKALGYVECSALKRINIDKVFQTAVEGFLGVNNNTNDDDSSKCCVIL
mmetsp:Transcript_49582/g.60854  ORF Transcript_49582/g.60854 Transcript_49582/m.60854 type:complete len:198 (-) Transcript_49582:204-797(-)